ncbi:MAG: hypothetical protein GX764_04505 [Firmicutes bacterium]|nr:hypothetical protein [Bacillota bacterium]
MVCLESSIKIINKEELGQGFKNKRYDGLGIGACTSGFDNYIKGCPPKARDIVEWIVLHLDSR